MMPFSREDAKKLATAFQLLSEALPVIFYPRKDESWRDVLHLGSGGVANIPIAEIVTRFELIAQQTRPDDMPRLHKAFTEAILERL